MDYSQTHHSQTLSKRFIFFWLVMGCVTIFVGAFGLEHSAIDVAIAQSFYQGEGRWLLEKHAEPWAFIFYDGIKGLLIVLSVVLLLSFLKDAMTFLVSRPQLRGQDDLSFSTIPFLVNRDATSFVRLQKFLKFPKVLRLSFAEQGYLLTCFICIPWAVAEIKRLTHVACPADLSMFAGELPYLSLWQSILSDYGNKCFPAAHASSGFAIMSVAFICQTAKWRYFWLVFGCVLGWLLGGYKMVIGDHFFSHTVTSMGFSWLIAAMLAFEWHKKRWL